MQLASVRFSVVGARERIELPQQLFPQSPDHDFCETERPVADPQGHSGVRNVQEEDTRADEDEEAGVAVGDHCVERIAHKHSDREDEE